MQSYWFTKTEQNVHNYKHKQLGHSLLFVKDPVLFPTAPHKFNCNVPRAALSQQTFGATYCQTSVSAKVREIIDPCILHSCDVYDVVSDFYQPPALPPIPEHLDSRAFRARLEAVRREHRNHNHKSWAQMRKSVDLGEIVGITRADIDNFALYKGCSSCVESKLTNHSQYPSTRELSVNYDTAQGDIFYIDFVGRMLPVLAVIDESSKTLCTYPFLAAARRSKANRVQITGVELREALASIIGVWKRAGRVMKVLRFDRESALNGVAYPNWAVDFGLQPRLNAAGQKLGLIESYGRVLKDHSRAVLAGIKNDFGYKFPLAYADEIIADVNCVLNCRQRSCPNPRVLWC
jgi:hypothetical protein